jgi:hypothetical protein
MNFTIEYQIIYLQNISFLSKLQTTLGSPAGLHEQEDRVCIVTNVTGSPFRPSYA